MTKGDFRNIIPITYGSDGLEPGPGARNRELEIVGPDHWKFWQRYSKEISLKSGTLKSVFESFKVASQRSCISKFGVIGMYIESVPNKANKPAVLLRESRRENGKVIKNTLANLSHLSSEIIENLRTALKGGELIDPNIVPGITECESTIPCGHVNAVLSAMKRLNMADLIDESSSRERDIVLGLIAARILNPKSKLATIRSWNTCTLASELQIEDADEQEIYAAMDWLLEKQSLIENKLAKRHLHEGGLAFLDMSSSYYEGEKSTLINKTINDDDESLVKFGYSRDKKKGKPQINYGLVTDRHGIPVSITIYPGNTSDSSIFLPTVNKIKNEFGIEKIVAVGDRGMITSKDIVILKQLSGVDWITALRSTSIKQLIAKPGFPLKLLDEYNLCEFSAPEEFPGERLAVCRNPELQAKREAKRISLLEATSKSLCKIKDRVDKGRLKKKEAIGIAVGKVIDKHSMGKHFNLDIDDCRLDFSLNEENIASEKILDGIYIIRSSLSAEEMEIEECVRQYKNLSNVERAFRTLKISDLRIRPIYHYLDHRIKMHIFLAMLSYYVEWHLNDIWREITFCDTEQELKKYRDPVASAKRSEKVLKKIRTKMSSSTLKAESFRTVMESLAAISKVTLCMTIPKTEKKIRYQKKPVLTPLQQKAYQLIEMIAQYP